MLIEREWIEGEWPGIVAHAGISEDRAQLIVVRDTQPVGAAECAYCQPSFNRPLDDPEVFAVVRRIGGARAAALHHIVAVWKELPECDPVAASALLRHEVEHARQWESYGPPLMDELEAELKTIAYQVGRSYHAAPVEQAADDAGRAWITTRYGEGEADRLAALFPHWQDAPMGARNASLRDETIAALRAWAPEGYEVSMPGGGTVTLDEFIAENSEPWEPMQAATREHGQSIEFID